MKKLLFVIAALACAAPAAARPTDSVGYCISDGFYGNEPNIIDPYAPGGPSSLEPGTKAGRIVPSQSPGPQLNNPNDPDNPFDGPSLGDFHEVISGGALPELCGQ